VALIIEVPTGLLRLISDKPEVITTAVVFFEYEPCRNYFGVIDIQAEYIRGPPKAA